jgi:hypothetical protein
MNIAQDGNVSDPAPLSVGSDWKFEAKETWSQEEHLPLFQSWKSRE